MGKPWKELEKKAAAALGGVRINRANDYGESNVDVVLPDYGFLRIDAKYRAKHAHHSLVEEIRDKYCKEGMWPVLVTKHRSSHREYVTVDLSLFGGFLKTLREYEILLKCKNSSSPNTCLTCQTEQQKTQSPETETDTGQNEEMIQNTKD